MVEGGEAVAVRPKQEFVLLQGQLHNEVDDGSEARMTDESPAGKWKAPFQAGMEAALGWDAKISFKQEWSPHGRWRGRARAQALVSTLAGVPVWSGT